MSMTRNNYSEIRFSDFGLVAALVTCGFSILRTEKDGRRILFIFSNTDELHKAVGEYWIDALLVPPRQYFESTKMLKSRIYSE